MTGAPDAGPEPEEGRTPEGDPVCWLERVCDACGALPDGPPEGRPDGVCERCGAPTAPA